ncbi:MAG: tryptophan--tRNA ligase, partial [Planctomycetales bacterium]|nr:tryptophan--tRNA ligase [Planctomycetales bacterium]
FTYPVLMAADILAYDANWVPVGQDQVQHIEVCRDLATSFNHHFAEVFVLPEARLLSNAAKVPGTDGEKMSKSYGNTIGIFEDPKQVRRKIMRMPTDSRAMEEAKDPDTDHLYQLFQLFGSAAEVQEMAELYRQGGFGYGQIKKSLADAAERYFSDAHARRGELANRPDTVDDILRAGAQRAREQASTVLERVERACGIAAK